MNTSRRSFLKNLTLAIPSIGVLPSLVLAKGKPVTKTHTMPSYLRSVTWDYAPDNIDPIAYIDGNPVKLFMWEVVSGYCIDADFNIYTITDKEEVDDRFLKHIKIHPVHVRRCNVEERWVEFIKPVIGGPPNKITKPVRDLQGRIKVFRLNNVHNLVVNLLSPQHNGDVIMTLRGK